MLFVGGWAGVLADRIDKRRLMYATQTAMMLFAFTLAGLVFGGVVEVGHVYVLAALTGVAATFDQPARRALIGELVDQDHINNAVGLSSAVFTGSRILGPAVAGLLISTVGVGWCFALNGLSFVGALAGLALMNPAEFHPGPRLAKGKGQIRAGVRYVWSSPALAADHGAGRRGRPVRLQLAGARAAAGHPHVPRIGHDLHDHHLDDERWLAARLAVAGPPAERVDQVPRHDLRGVRGRVAASSPRRRPCPSPWPRAWSTAALGITFMSGTMTFIQVEAVPEMRGRAMALYTIVFLGTTPIGGPIVGWIAEQFGARAGLALGGRRRRLRSASARLRIVAAISRRSRPGPAAPDPAPVRQA